MASLANAFEMRVVFNGAAAGYEGDVINVLHYNAGAQTKEVGEGIAKGIIAAFKAATAYLALLTTEVSLTRIEYHGLGDDTIGGEEGATGASGTGTGELVSLRSAVVVKKVTAKRGRQFQGRLYLPSVVETAQAGGQLTSSAMAAIRSYTDNLRVVGGANLGVLASRKERRGDSIVRIPDSIENVTDLLVRKTLGSIRGRQRVA